ncbi:ankyrin repeat-containing protein [Stylonychia lemnae]|uniref:Ankyrin repeat-containing protein n=1 Tax=Stylonychia lemnae TaxID=5949 RepID=A0A078BB23_STYLE|nr:ankyrin repeat-containing protein [Stylonychia lemnae]|eukprot:CDW91599.1 ankyrin repeat-containing protein [Stylonychia lemnae]
MMDLEKTKRGLLAHFYNRPETPNISQSKFFNKDYANELDNFTNNQSISDLNFVNIPFGRSDFSQTSKSGIGLGASGTQPQLLKLNEQSSKKINLKEMKNMYLRNLRPKSSMNQTGVISSSSNALNATGLLSQNALNQSSSVLGGLGTPESSKNSKMQKKLRQSSYSALNFSAKTREKQANQLNRSVNNSVNLHNYTNQQALSTNQDFNTNSNQNNNSSSNQNTTTQILHQQVQLNQSQRNRASRKNSPQKIYEKFQKKLEKMNEAIKNQRLLNQQLAQQISTSQERLPELSMTQYLDQKIFNERPRKSKSPQKSTKQIENVKDKFKLSQSALMSPNTSQRKIISQKSTIPTSLDTQYNNEKLISNIRLLRRQMNQTSLINDQSKSKNELINEIINITLPKSIKQAPVSQNQSRERANSNSISNTSKLYPSQNNQMNSTHQFKKFKIQSKRTSLQESIMTHQSCSQHNHHRRRKSRFNYKFDENTFEGHRLDEFCFKQQKLLEYLSIKSTMLDLKMRWLEAENLVLSSYEVANAMLNYKYQNRRRLHFSNIQDQQKMTKFFKLSYWKKAEKGQFMNEEKDCLRRHQRELFLEQKQEMSTQIIFEGIKGLTKPIRVDEYFYRQQNQNQLFKRAFQRNVVKQFVFTDVKRVRDITLLKSDKSSIIQNIIRERQLTNKPFNEKFYLNYFIVEEEYFKKLEKQYQIATAIPFQFKKHIVKMKQNNDFDQFELQCKIPCISIKKIKAQFEHSYGVKYFDNFEILIQPKKKKLSQDHFKTVQVKHINLNIKKSISQNDDEKSSGRREDIIEQHQLLKSPTFLGIYEKNQSANKHADLIQAKQSPRLSVYYNNKEMLQTINSNGELTDEAMNNLCELKLEYKTPFQILKDIIDTRYADTQDAQIGSQAQYYFRRIYNKIYPDYKHFIDQYIFNGEIQYDIICDYLLDSHMEKDRQFKLLEANRINDINSIFRGRRNHIQSSFSQLQKFIYMPQYIYVQEMMLKENYIKQIFKRYRQLVRKTRTRRIGKAVQRQDKAQKIIIPDEIEIDKQYERLIFFEEPTKYDVIGENSQIVRLADEFLYKLVFKNNDDDFIGYEFFRMQHKNMLRNKLQRGFRKMLFILIHKFFEQESHMEQQNEQYLQDGEKSHRNGQDFRTFLGLQIRRFLIKKQRLAIICFNEVKQSSYYLEENYQRKGSFACKIRDINDIEDYQIEKMEEDNQERQKAQKERVDLKLEFDLQQKRQNSIDKILYHRRLRTKQNRRGGYYIQLSSGVYDSDTSQTSKYDPIIKKEVLKLKEKIVKEYSFRRKGKNSIELEREAFNNDFRYELLLNSLQTEENADDLDEHLLKYADSKQNESSLSSEEMSIRQRQRKSILLQRNIFVIDEKSAEKASNGNQNSHKNNIRYRQENGINIEILDLEDQNKIDEYSQSQQLSDSISTEKVLSSCFKLIFQSKLRQVIRVRKQSSMFGNQPKQQRMNSNLYEKELDNKIISIVSNDSHNSHLVIKPKSKQMFDSIQRNQGNQIELKIMRSLKDQNYILAEHLMKKHKFNLNFRDSKGNDYLNLAAQLGQPDIIRLLLSKNADANTINKQGNTPLHYALINQNTAVEDLLLKNGANTQIKNNEGKKPFDY